ncbi:ribonuclease R [Pseudohaliea rubra]|uniref:Ribonuclease R n=1 Tax=Pseudohaliea rubra DSM 19751 TaxID=1265313 RepID=A0A095VQP1_9GAMM|nr:ribonuclease R [Pseudohaliea rubra]KGE03777.1 3'-to-5' exoribonuclease RNase R [Pseudohaliea rubra DSM 19751]
MARKGKKADPHAAREAANYDNPIPSREFILEQLRAADRPLDHGQVAELLALSEEQELDALRNRLRAMQRDGQLLVDRRGAYGVVDAMNLLRCRVQGHRDGYGFAMPVSGGEDVYLSARQMRVLFDGDTVLVAVTGIDRRGRAEGKVVEVLERGVDRVVGRYQEESGIGVVIPDNARLTHDVLIPPKARGGAKHGQIVTAEITDYPTGRLGAKGRVVEVLGDHLDPGLEIDVAIRAHGIPFEWPDAVVDEAGHLHETVAEEDKRARIDLRDLPFVTIDGEDAKDFDDAVYCRKKRLGGWKLWVAIADVSHYVHPGSALDSEAARRGNSVYFPERVVPMLPEVLSNGLCSLKPEVDRLAMVVEMDLGRNGELGKFQFYEAVIHSHARLTYTQVGQVLAGEQEPAVPAARIPDLKRLHDLYKVLRRAREERGAIDFETVETRIIFDEQRKISQIVPVVRNDAHKLIEECMLAANVATARFFEKHPLPTLFRVHEGPGEEKLENLRAFLGELGLGLRGGTDPSPRDYQALMEEIQDRPDAHVIQTMLLRSLRQAVYQPENKGHFGLNYEGYAHFTSPIRRYPDLIIHRGIRAMIRSKQRSRLLRRADGATPLLREESYPYDERTMVVLGEQCSMTERRADDATRDVNAWLKCEYLQDRVGDEFAGVVAAVTSFGLFVELSDLYIEGLVHVTALPGDYYRFDPAHQRLVGERSGRSFQLGDKLTVQVARVDLDDKKIDLEPVELPTTGKAARSRRGGPSAGRDSTKAGSKSSGRAGAKGGDKADDKAGGSGSRRGSGKDAGQGRTRGKGSRGEGAAPAAAKPAQKTKDSAAAGGAPSPRKKGDESTGGRPGDNAGQKSDQKSADNKPAGKKSTGQRRRRRR